jgi:hypothetical protein
MKKPSNKKVRFLVGRGTSKEGVVEAIKDMCNKAGLQWVPSKKKGRKS